MAPKDIPIEKINEEEYEETWNYLPKGMC